jgi:hypothetical protein
MVKKIEKAATSKKIEKAAIAAAAVGGVFPNLLKLAVSLCGNTPPNQPLNVRGYVVGLVIYAALGCTVAWIWNERIPQKAFYLGIGLPALIQAANMPLNGVNQQIVTTKTQMTAPATQTRLSFFSTSAFAQTPPLTTQRGQPLAPVAIKRVGIGAALSARPLTIMFTDIPIDTRVVFRDAAGQVVASPSPDWANSAKTNGKVLLAVPSGATQLELQSAVARNTPNIQLPTMPGDIMPTLRLDTKTDFTSGLLDALGFQAAHSLKITVIKPPASSEGTVH